MAAGAVSWSQVAGWLLQERLLLTALELHTELVESGREEPQLREFFSNPANFERPQPIVRCPSQATLDSLDLTRLSEDSERSDDVAILEFELRKAKETINALRANLTQAAECDSSSADLSYDKLTSEEPIKAHEKRALNFLIYEYLLRQDCKLTSITFSDEVPDQDFECWDDVGLNIPRPPDLISLYRRETVQRAGEPGVSKETQTDEPIMNDNSFSFFTRAKSEGDCNVDTYSESEEILFLKKQILALETDKVNYQKLYDAALASLNSLTSPTSDIPSSETTLYNRDDVSVEMMHSNSQGLNYSCEGVNIEDEMQPLPQTAAQNYYSGSVSTNSLTPDQFEMIENDKNEGSQKDESNTSSYENPILIEGNRTSSPKPKRKTSLTTMDDVFSFNDSSENDWEPRKKPSIPKTLDIHGSNMQENSELWINSNLHIQYKEALLNFCDLKYTKQNVLFKDIPSNSRPISPQEFVSVVSAALPKIIPNILLVKRDEVIPLLICAIFLHSEQSQRDKLLQLLLNFKKKLEKDDRSLIISGLVLLLQWNSEMNCGLDSDLLGFFWEMLNSKSPEKRLLGAEASVALAPYISLDLVNSLLLSMVLSMCDSSDISIRKQGLLGALLISPTATSTKYSQLENIFFSMAFDSDIALSNMAIDTFTPILARSTLLNGMFHSEFSQHIISKLAITNAIKVENIILNVKILNSTVIFALYHVINADIIKSNIVSNDDTELPNWLSEYLQDRPFHNPLNVFEDKKVNPSQLIRSFYSMTESDFSITWEEKEWFIDHWFKKILEILATCQYPLGKNLIESFIELVETVGYVFGQSFTRYVIKPILEEELNTIEQRMIKSEYQNKFCLVLISLYLGIFSTLENNEEENVTTAINKWCICCGMCTVPAQFIGIPIVRYSYKAPNLLNAALSAMRQCVIHSNEQVRAFIASLFDYLVQYANMNENILKTCIVPAMITLVGDSATSVKCNAIKSLGAVISRGKLPQSAYDKCWLTLEDLVIEEKTNGTLGTHTTTCLVKTFYKIINSNNLNCNKALPNLVMLCYSPVFSTDNISAINGILSELLPTLQLATQANLSEHFVFNSLVPALRKLESANQQILSEHRLTIESLIHKMTSNEQVTERIHHTTPTSSGHSFPSILANSESVGRRVTQIFQHSKPAMNLQNIFKKK